MSPPKSEKAGKVESRTYQMMLDEVEQVVRDISAPRVDLDTMVARIERGYELITAMRERLAQTRERVEKLRSDHEAQQTTSSGGASKSGSDQSEDLDPSETP